MTDNDIPHNQNEMASMNIDHRSFDDLRRTSFDDLRSASFDDLKRKQDPLANLAGSEKQGHENKVFIYCDKKLSETKLNTETSVPSIIGNSERADIHVPYYRWAAEHISVTRIEDLLYFVDRTETNLVSFNGEVCKLAVCRVDERMIVRSDETWFIYDGRPNNWRSDIDKDLPSITVSYGNRIEEHSTHRPILIGSHPGCDLVMSKECANPFQAIVYWCSEGINLNMRSRSQGVVVDYPLEDDSAVNINGQQVVLSFIGDVYHTVDEYFSAFPEELEPCLLFGEGDNAQILPIQNGTSFTIGSDESTDITIVDTELDKVQAKVDVRNNSLRIANVGVYGTVKINGEEIKRGKASLGDRVEVGSYQFYVLLNF